MKSASTGELFQAYTLAKEEDIRAAFFDRFGHPPAEVFRSGPIMLAGPVDGELSKRAEQAGMKLVGP